MRLIVPDRYSVYSGVETINRHLLPALVRQGVPVTWVVPDHRIAGFRAAPECADVRLEDAFWPRGSWRRWVEGLARRGGRFGGASLWAARIEKHFYRARIETLAEGEGDAHAFSTWILSEDFPGLPVPHSALFLDRNWACAPGEGDVEKAGRLDARVRTWAAGAHRMFAISECAARELRELAPAHAGKIVHLPLAATAPLIAATAPERNRERARPTVFYYPATANPHKNHRTLFAAAAMLAAERLPFRVVLSGFATPGLLGDAVLADPRTEAARSQFARARGLLAGVIEARGYGSPADVEANYRACDCVVLPSEYEGFGLPLAEALGRRRPVIASDIEPFREQIAFYGAQETVAKFTPTSVEELAAHMRRVIAGQTPSAEALQEVEKRVARWTWDRVAAVFLEGISE